MDLSINKFDNFYLFCQEDFRQPNFKAFAH